jgi:probable F420-dependent oxidoreductase
VKVYAGMDPRLPLRDVGAYARRVEALGFDGVHVAETVNDSMLAAVLAVEHTTRITVRTAVTLAFVRSPTLTAYDAWALAQLSDGRFELGLGTQIRQNIEDRFAMPWSEPIARLRDYVGALHAVLEAFRTGTSVRYDGSIYRITRLQPFFNPGPDERTRAPALWLGAVNPAACRLAGELAAGVVSHPTNSDPRYLGEVVLPQLATGAAASGRSPDDVRLVVAVTIATGVDDEEVRAERERQRRLLAFLYSTPAYAATLALHGRPDLGPRLRELTRTGAWDELPTALTDEVLDLVVVSAPFDRLASALRERVAGLATEIVLPPLGPARNDPQVAGVVRALHGGTATDAGAEVSAT